MNNEEFDFTPEFDKYVDNVTYKATLLNMLDEAIATADEAKAMAQEAIAKLEQAKEENRKRTQAILDKYPLL